MAYRQTYSGVSESASVEALTILVETVEKLSSARRPEDIAAVVRTSARKLTGADGIAVVLRDEDRCHYVDEDAVGPLWKGLKFPMTACISGWSMLNKTTAVIPDIYQDPRIPHDAYRSTFVKSLVMTPIGQPEPFAALGAYWATERVPSDWEIDMLESLARTTATAFENCRLFNSLSEAVSQRDFLIRELDHRVKNMLASIQAIARQTMRTARDQQTFVEVFSERLQALSHAHEVLARRRWKDATLKELSDVALAPFRDAAGHIEVEGPEVGLKPETAVAVMMGVHELGTNAAKYGALTSPQGKVRLSWAVDMASEPRTLTLDWQETGGPTVAPPTSRGLGSQLIEKGIARALGGKATLDFAPSGVRFSLQTSLSDRVALA